MPATAGANTIQQGQYGLYQDFIDKRIYDKSMMAVTLDRFDYPLASILLTEKPKKIECFDLTPKRATRDEIPVKLTTVRPIALTNYTQFEVSDAEAAKLQPGIMLKNTYINYTAAAGYTIGTTANHLTTVKNHEVAKVVAVGSAGSGPTAAYTLITIQRASTLLAGVTTGLASGACWGQLASADAAVSALNQPISVLGRTAHDGAGIGIGVVKDLGFDTSYLQYLDHDIELTDWNRKSRKFGTSDEWGDQVRQGLAFYMRNLSSSLMFSHGAEYLSNGSNAKEFNMSSLSDAVSAAAVQPITGPNFAAFNKALAPIADVGGGNERWLIGGGEWYDRFAAVLEPKQLYIDPEVNKTYGMEVRNYTARGKTYRIAIDRNMSEDTHYKYGAFVVNTKHLEYGYFTGEDIKFEDNLQAPGQRTRHGRWTSTLGLLSTFRGSATEVGSQGYIYWPSL